MTLTIAITLLAASCSSTGTAADSTGSAASNDGAQDSLAFVESSTTTALPPRTTTTTEPTPEPPRFTYGPATTDLTWLADQAALAAVAALPVDMDQLDLTGKPVLADRVSIGLEAIGMAFTRSNGTDALGHVGTVITLHDDQHAVLQRWSHREQQISDDARAVRQETVAALSGDDLDYSSEPVSIDADSWLIAESAPPQQLASDITGAPRNVVAWSNREAQSYTAQNVSVSDGGITISTRSKTSTPSIDALPNESGMVISSESFGWSTITADVRLPVGVGLWPAMWLLDAEACEAPGRCSGFDTPDYHEIDILETDGSLPPTIHTTAHWWETNHTSTTATTAVAGFSHEIQLERRPGVLIWRIDGEIAHVVTGRVDTFDSGPHRAGEMMLIVNTAVGGTFAGTAEIGREGAWLGEAIVPASYPQPIDATFTLQNVRINNR